MHIAVLPHIASAVSQPVAKLPFQRPYGGNGAAADAREHADGRRAVIRFMDVLSPCRRA